MKNNNIRVIAILLSIVLLMFCFSACTTIEKDTKEENSMFVVIEETAFWDIVYHRETKVMYAVSGGTYNCGTFTVLYNVDGTPMTYSKEGTNEPTD